MLRLIQSQVFNLRTPYGMVHTDPTGDCRLRPRNAQFERIMRVVANATQYYRCSSTSNFDFVGVVPRSAMQRRGSRAIAVT